MTIHKKSNDHSDEWQLQEAKNRLSRVVEEARRGKPQTITVRGTPAVVVMSFEQYREFTKSRPPLSEFFQSSPLREFELDLERSRDFGREIEL